MADAAARAGGPVDPPGGVGHGGHFWSPFAGLVGALEAMVKLALVQLDGWDTLSDFDRQRNREEALHRLEQGAEAVVRKPFPSSAF